MTRRPWLTLHIKVSFLQNLHKKGFSQRKETRSTDIAPVTSAKLKTERSTECNEWVGAFVIFQALAFLFRRLHYLDCRLVILKKKKKKKNADQIYFIAYLVIHLSHWLKWLVLVNFSVLSPVKKSLTSCINTGSWMTTYHRSCLELSNISRSVSVVIIISRSCNWRRASGRWRRLADCINRVSESRPTCTGVA